MKQWHYRLSGWILFGFLTLQYVTAAAQHASEPVPAWLRQPDLRLEQRLRVEGTQVCIGELLYALTKASGVALDATEKAADFTVSLYLLDSSLLDILEGVRSLYSNRGAEWNCQQQEVSPGVYRYTLVRSPGARTLGARLRDEIERRFAQNLDDQIAWLSADAKERISIEMRNPEIAPLVRDDILQGGIRVLAGHFSSEQRKALLHFDQTGHGSAKITPLEVERLSESERQWLDGIRDRMFRGQAHPTPYPACLTIFSDRSERDIFPCLWISIGDAGAYAYVGGIQMDSFYEARAAALWRREEERIVSPLADRKIEPPKNLEQAPSGDRAPRLTSSLTLSQRLKEVARLAQINILSACTDMQIREGSPQYYGRTLREYLDILDKRSKIMTKTSRGIVLFQEKAWCWNQQEESLIPWEQVRHWRAALQKNDGYFTLRELEQMTSVNEKQAERLRAEFPEIQGVISQPLFRFWASLPPLQKRTTQTGRGLRLKDVSAERLAILSGEAPSISETWRSAVLRMVSAPIEIQTPDGKKIQGMRFEAMLERPHEPSLYAGVFFSRRTPDRRNFNAAAVQLLTNR
jgi:hypothetical protein